MLDLKQLNNPEQIEALGQACADPAFSCGESRRAPARHRRVEAATRPSSADRYKTSRQRTATNSRSTRRRVPRAGLQRARDFGHKPRAICPMMRSRTTSWTATTSPELLVSGAVGRVQPAALMCARSCSIRSLIFI